MTIFDVDIGAPSGGSADMDRNRGQVVQVVNVARFGPRTEPQDGEIVAAVEKPQPR